MNNSIYKCPICGGPTNYSSINYQPQPCLHCNAMNNPADQHHKNDQHAPPYGTLFDAGKPNEQTTPAPTPWSAKSEAYWHNQYQLMREKYWERIGENSKQLDRIRELEEQLKVKEFLLNQAIKDLETEQAANRELYAMLGHIVDWSPELPYYMKDEYKTLFRNALAAAIELLSKCSVKEVK